jgi:hypothetical protein
VSLANLVSSTSTTQAVDGTPKTGMNNGGIIDIGPIFF